MWENRILKIAGCFILSVSLVFLLYAMSNKIKHDKNGFIRLFPPHPISYGKILDIRFNSFYIAGLSSNFFFLGNFTSSTLLRSNYTLTDTGSIKPDLPLIKTTTPQNFRFTVDSPDIYLIDRLTTSLYYGHGKDSCRLVCKLDSFQFIAAVPLSPTSFILRKYNKLFNQNTLEKIDIHNVPILKKIFLLEKYSEGVFSTDGMLSYDPSTKKLVYVYFYRNQFEVLDPNLQLVLKGNTIDTISTPKIKVAEIPSEHVNTISAPPTIVNLRSAVSGNWLFINSGLQANNETKDLFVNHSVIDIYSLEDGKYKFSFYLPKYNGKKCSEFKVHNNILIAMYDHFLVAYQLHLNL